MYEAAFRAVEPAFADFSGLKPDRRFAYNVYGAPRTLQADEALGPATDLRACPDLQQVVLAAGFRIVGRPLMDARPTGSAPYEHFSRPVRRGGVVHMTYWQTDEVRGVDVVLRKQADGAWKAEAVGAFEVESVTVEAPRRCPRTEPGCG